MTAFVNRSSRPFRAASATASGGRPCPGTSQAVGATPLCLARLARGAIRLNQSRPALDVVRTRRVEVGEDSVPSEDTLEAEARLLEDPHRCPIVGVAQCVQPADAELIREVRHRARRFRGVPVAPGVPSQHVTGPRAVRGSTSSPVDPMMTSCRLAMTYGPAVRRRPCLVAPADERQRVVDGQMSGPPQQPGDLGVACVVLLHRLSVRGDRPAEQQPFGGDRLRCAHLQQGTFQQRRKNRRVNSLERAAASRGSAMPPSTSASTGPSGFIGCSAPRASNRSAHAARRRRSAQPSPPDGRDGTAPVSVR